MITWNASQHLMTTATTFFKVECNDILFKIDDKLGSKMKCEDAEELVTLVLEYGEYKRRQYFIKGFATGASMQNCMKNGM